MRERPPGSGQWQLRAYLGTDTLTSKPRQVARTFRGSERAAAKALAELVVEAEAGKFDTTTLTVGQLLDKWLEHGETSQRPRTLYENRRKVEARIRPTLGHVRLSKLARDPGLLDEAYRRWLDDGLSPATVHKFHSILSAAFRFAVKRGYLAQAPTARATPPVVRRPDLVVPTPEQLTKLIKAAEGDDPVFGSAIALAALTGARRGELVALRWSDVDLRRGTVRIARSLTVTGGEQHTGPTKTHAARELALDPVAVEVLRRRHADMVSLSEAAESPLIDDPFVLSYNANAALPVNPDTFTHRFGRLCQRMEKPALDRLRRRQPKATREDLAPASRWPFRFHDLRHFSVTTLIAAGVDVRTVAERHGHARATMTLDRYAHALPERDREAAAVLGGALKLEER